VNEVVLEVASVNMVVTRQGSKEWQKDGKSLTAD
jgi:hypothetical protein